eukprot:scaffold176222_cov29-Tisochrysis_lutea.AAC.6
MATTKSTLSRRPARFAVGRKLGRNSPHNENPRTLSATPSLPSSPSDPWPESTPWLPTSTPSCALGVGRTALSS